MPYMPITESMFLLAESREHPMHVGGLQLFEPAEGSDDLGEQMFEAFQAQTDVHKLFRKRPASPVGLMGTVRWSYDSDVDFEYHVRRTVLPRPGRVRELLRYVSANHGAMLDRHRPMWELHLIEGLADGRIALYTKIHHSLVDGVSALKLLEKTLSPDAAARSGRAPWDPELFIRRPRLESEADEVSRSILSEGWKIAGELAGFAPATARVGIRAVRDHNLKLPLQAPRTMFNVPIGGARRFAAEQWSVTRLKAVAAGLDITMNDVVMAMCAGALRSYLIDQNALPEQPLIAMMPVSMHAKDSDSSEGNAVTAILANLATDQPDPERRLATLVDSTRSSKQVIRELSPLQALGFGAMVAAPLALSTVPGFVRYTPPPFNVIISNVPGPQKDMYWNGAKLDGVYPASIALDGQALNITVATNGDMVNFGLTGARAEVPSLQRLLTHLDTALEELEKLCDIGA
ncbi:wax ester/triacylglycerol synthase family O-acyltransferase [Williamsia sp. 1138]|uniref:Diacylglycerol O-acyltransferase n=1 Tax=Gordonia rubripertincta TaxID=36822 RepID=A0ABT4MQR8_GORRU|nr:MULTISPECIES: wax ester/triacylglycerol synthase family O-acyltransferase [Mycobacteriales]MCZ4549328.1 wax ester/triacylglycerol synthase family O-acyltransferase [Gordonia rubripertincta]OZG29025.1 wax ester/triacylglycerol synthase family O-acyltransferase [Williamsia sp. 1138]